MKYEATIAIPADEAKEMQAILDGEADNEGNDEVVNTYTAEFPNKWQADIKVVDAEPPYVDPVLFNENGQEVACIEVADKLIGEYEFAIGEDTYHVIVKEALRCETPSREVADEIAAHFVDWANDGNWTPPEEDGGMVGEQDLQVDFEHGQWWVTHKPTGAQWSANDTEVKGDDTYDFEQVSVGDSE